MMFSSLFAASFVIAGALGSLTGTFNDRTGTPSSSGIHNGFFYSWTSDGAENANYTNLDGGTYSVEWSGSVGYVAGGKGWNPGKWGQVLNYNGTYYPNGNSMLGVYGWTRNTTDAIVEYWILESYGSLNPGSGLKRMGNTTCFNDGVELRYDIYYVSRPYNFPPIEGEENYQQFWSIRTPIRKGKVKGTIDTDCHFAAWKNLGMELGERFAYQIFMTDGFYSSGNATITVS